jgi:hypothetical protein
LHGRPRPNDPPERVCTDALARTTRPNEFARTPSPERPARTSLHGRPLPNDPPERVCTDDLARPARTSLHGRPRPTRPNEFTRAPSNDPPERVYMANDLPERVYMANDPPERVFTRQTTRSNEFTWALTHDQNEGTREIRANGQHNRAESPPPVTTLHFLYGNVCPGCRHTTRHDPTRPAPTRLHGHPHTTRPDPPERNLGFPWAHDPNEILGFLWAHDPNEGTGERQANGPHERAEDTRAVTT